jgi:ATP-binding cassette subfamily C protein CydCD
VKPLDPRLLQHARATRLFLAVSVLLGVVAAGCVITQAGVLAHAVSAVFLGGAGLAGIRRDLAILAGAVGLRAVLAWAQEAVAARSAATVKSQLRAALLGRLVALGPQWTTGRRTGELAQLATRGVDALDPYFARYLPQLVLGCVVPPLVLVRLGTADLLSGLLVLATLPIIPIFMVLVGLSTQARTRRQWRTLGRLSAHFLDVVDGLPTLRVFGRAKAQEGSIAAVTDAYRRATMGVLRISFLSGFVLELAAALSVALVAVQVGLRLLAGGVGLQTALLVLILAPEAYLPLRQIGANHHAAAEGLAAADGVLRVLDTAPPAAGSAEVPPVQVHGVSVEVVSVCHPGNRAAALPPTSLDLVPGEVVALVGPSGAGKSTLLSVLLGFQPATTGVVRVGGVDLADADPDRWRCQVAWAPQRPVLLAGTVADNVRLGAPDAARADVLSALERAAGGEISPDLVLGEDGAGLSAGQRQRVALARAFLRAERGAGLLLLDEPTSHLDVVTEARVVAGVRELARGRCVLLVVHRPVLAAAADRVVRLGAQSLQSQVLSDAALPRSGSPPSAAPPSESPPAVPLGSVPPSGVPTPGAGSPAGRTA